MKLYDHQQKIIKDDPKRTGLFLGTGSGKTRTALHLASGKVLVIAPKTQVEDRNWEREAGKILGQIKLRSLRVISKETFRRDWDSLHHYDTVIVDEAHTCLGVTPNTRQRKRQQVPRASQIFEALANYLDREQPERLYLCTATIIKSPMTVWAAHYLLTGGMPMPVTLQSFLAFRDTYYVKLPMPGRDVYAPKKDSATKDSLASIVRSIGYTGRLEDYFDVPAQTFRTIHVPLLKAQQDRIKELKLEYPDPIVYVGKRHQVENGVLAGDEFKVPEFFDNTKLDKVEELAEEFPRMVIFAKYRAQIDRMADVLTHKGYKVFVLTGDTKDRGKLIAEASKSVGIFIAQAQISAGWELPDYPVMVFASRTYSYVDYAQGIGRIQRANNIKKNLYINLVVKGGVDDAVDEALMHKQDFDERIYIK